MGGVWHFFFSCGGRNYGLTGVGFFEWLCGFDLGWVVLVVGMTFREREIDGGWSKKAGCIRY